MSQRSKEREVAVLEFLKDHPQATDEDTGMATGIPRSTVGDIRQRIGIAGRPVGALQGNNHATHPSSVKPGEHELTDERMGDQRILTVKSCDIRTIEQALELSQVDTKVWRVADKPRPVLNHWQVTMRTGVTSTTDGETTTSKHDVNTYDNFQIKFALERIVPAATQDAFDNIFADMKKYAPKYPVIHRPKLTDEKFLYEIAAMADPQIGRLSWGKETGVDYDVKIATTNAINRKIFEVTRLEQQLEVFDSVVDAVKSYR